MLRDVNITLTDGGLLSSPTGTGVHVKIGASYQVSAEPILITGSMTAQEITKRLGHSPLADACMDSINFGASTIYCIPVAPSVEGTVGEVIKTGAGTGTITVSGKPNNDFKVIFKIITDGALNTATVKYSINGGVTYSPEQTIPTGGKIAALETGLEFTFAGSTFTAGDTYTVVTTAPKMTNENILSATAKLKTFSKEFEFIHIVGGTDKALWNALSVEINTLVNKYHKPIFAVLEASYTPNATAEEYASGLIADRRGISNKYLQVVSAFGTLKRMDNTTKTANLAGLVCGLYASSKVSQSIGETKTFSISEDKLLSLAPIGIEEHISDLDDAGYLTLRKYDGLKGFYVTNAKTFADEISDYQYAERIRVANKAVRQVRKEMLLQLQSAVDIANLDSELEAIARLAEAPLDKMVRDKEISSARIIIPTGQDILGTDKLVMKIRFVPVGYLREIDIDMGMENPFKQ